MKRSFILIIIAMLMTVSNATVAQSNTKAENTIEAVYLSLLAWRSNNCTYIMPLQKIFNTETGALEGQKFYAMGGYGFMEIRFDRNGDEINNVFYKEKYEITVEITWDDHKISTVKAPGYLNYDYTVNYDNNNRIIGLLCNDLLFDGQQKKYFKFDYDQDKISSLTSILFKATQTYEQGLISTSNVYAYSPNEVKIDFLKYKRDQPNVPQFISKQDTVVFTYNLKEKEFREQGLNKGAHRKYNDANQLVYEQTSNPYRVYTATKEYFKGEEFREIVIETKASKFIEKKIYIKFTRDDLPESAPDYQRIEGIYKFNEQGDMTWISQNGKYKQLVDGVWSEWKFMSY